MSSKEVPPPLSGPDDMLALDDVARHFRVCTKTVRRLVKRFDIPVMRVGKQIRIPARYLPLFVTKT